MRILLCSIYYDADSTGIARYSAEMAQWLVARGHEVDAIAAPPHYPQWRVEPSLKRRAFYRETDGGVRIFRCPLYVPAADRVTTIRRLLYEASFALSSSLRWLERLLDRRGYDAVIAVCPSLHSAYLPLLNRRLTRTPWILHVQDLQVDAAVQLGILENRAVARFLYALEAFVLKQADVVSTITTKMRDRVVEKGVARDRTFLLPNWADLDAIRPGPLTTPFRRELGIGDAQQLFMYAGNMGDKQGLEIVIDAAERLRDHPEIQFVLIGDGAAKERLRTRAAEKRLENLRFRPLQPRERLGEVLTSADVHLVVQKAEAADIVMPSKLTNILAAGRPCIVTAPEGTTLQEIVDRNRLGLVSEPESVDALLASIRSLSEDRAFRERCGVHARAYAEQHLGKDAILTPFERFLEGLGGGVVGRGA